LCIASIEKAHEYSPDIPIEILVVIQKANQKKDIQARYPEITTFYYIDKIGLSVARNFAITKSTGNYFVFLDDDASVNEDFIDVLFREIKVHNKINAFCGRLIDPVKHIPFSPLFCKNKVKKLRRIDFQYFMGSAHVLSGEAIKRIGCYDERFGVGCRYYGSEESDIFFRLKAAGEQVIYLPDLIFFHPIPVTPSNYVYKYGYSFAAMLTKNIIRDKANFIIYFFIILKKIAKAYIRLMQKWFLKGEYVEKDKKYHYGDLLNGTFNGIGDFIKNELHRRDHP